MTTCKTTDMQIGLTTNAAQEPKTEDDEIKSDLFDGAYGTNDECRHSLKIQQQDWKSGIQLFKHRRPFPLKYHKQVLQELDIAYETWGHLNTDKTNVIMLVCALTAGSHAKSHQANPSSGWWEKFIGPGLPLDTNKYYVICASNIGSCYGSSGPPSIDPKTNKPYATTFPIISIQDMTHALFLLLDHLNVEKLHCIVGASLGGMISLLSSVLYPDRIGSLISISSCLQSYPTNIAINYLMTKAIMNDPNWNNGYYYDGPSPSQGIRLSREIGTLTYRSAREWNGRFGRRKILGEKNPTLQPHFEIENYVRHQGDTFQWRHDSNALIYTLKAVELFDVGDLYDSQEEALQRISCPVLVLGVDSDVLYPTWQQQEIVTALKQAGHCNVKYETISSIYGHDTFLIDVKGVGSKVKTFIESGDL